MSPAASMRSLVFFLATFLGLLRPMESLALKDTTSEKPASVSLKDLNEVSDFSRTVENIGASLASDSNILLHAKVKLKTQDMVKELSEMISSSREELRQVQLDLGNAFPAGKSSSGAAAESGGPSQGKTGPADAIKGMNAEALAEALKLRGQITLESFTDRRVDYLEKVNTRSNPEGEFSGWISSFRFFMMKFNNNLVDFQIALEELGGPKVTANLIQELDGFRKQQTSVAAGLPRA